MQFRRVSTSLVMAAVAATAACSGGEKAAADSAGAAMANGASTAAAGVDSAVSGPAVGTGTGVGAASSNNLNDPSTVTQVDAIISAASGGLTSLSGSAAIAAIDPVREKLHNSGKPALESIADDLDDLRDKLDDSPIKGGEIGPILAKIGPKVTAVAKSPDAGAAAERLTTLGSALTKAGGTIK